MSVRLTGRSGGDSEGNGVGDGFSPRIYPIPSPENRSERERTTPTHFLPLYFRERAREILLRSKDQRKSLSQARSRAIKILSNSEDAEEIQIEAEESRPRSHMGGTKEAELKEEEVLPSVLTNSDIAEEIQFEAEESRPRSRRGDIREAESKEEKILTMEGVIGAAPTDGNSRPKSRCQQREGSTEFGNQRYECIFMQHLKARSNSGIQDQGGGTINQREAPPSGLTNHHNPSNKKFEFTEYTMASSGNKAIAAGKGDASGSGGKKTEATNPQRRPGKELMEEMGTEEEKKAIVVDMNKAKGAVRARLLAVGIFISMLTVSTRNVVDTMKRIWNVRGFVEFGALGGRRFVLEFKEEGDFTHVTDGGPWRYMEDPVLIQALGEGQNPEEVIFRTVPIWVQFRDIPYYLLSKELARRLGRKVGHLITIDNNSRGELCDKMLRARVKLPIDTPLLRWTPLKDELTEETVVSSIFYERLPTFCLCCGVIEHQQANCPVHVDHRVKRFGRELGVPPTPRKDMRSWLLPEKTGQARHQPSPALNWRRTYDPITAPNRQRQLVIVAQVAEEVNKLSVQDQIPPDAAPGVGVGGVVLASPTSPAASAASKQASNHGGQEEVERKDVKAHAAAKKGGTWTRRTRGEETDGTGNDKRTTQGVPLGDTRKRSEEDPGEQSPMKKIMMHVPSLEECLGKETLKNLREAEITGQTTAHKPGSSKEARTECVDSFSLEIITDSNVGSNVIGKNQDGKEKQGSIQERENVDEEEEVENNNHKTGPEKDGMKPGAEESAWGSK